MIRRLAGCIKEYKKDTLLTPAFVVLEVIMEVITPLLMANLIDFGVEAGNMSYILKMGTALVMACVMSLLFGVLSGWYAARSSAGFARNLRRDMFYNMQNYSFSNIDKFSTSSIITRLTTDVSNVQNSFQMITPHCGSKPCHARIFTGYGLCHQCAAGADFCLCRACSGNWALFDHDQGPPDL